MKILINTATTFKGGGVQVAYSFVKECINFPENEYLVVLGEGIGKLIREEDFPENFTFFRIPYRPATKVFSFKDQASFFKKIEKRYLPDVVFTTSGPAYWRPKAPHLMGFNLAHYLYKDSQFYSIISPFRRLRWYLKGVVIKHYTMRDADAYVVQTDDINARLKKWINSSNIYTVTNTYGNQYNAETHDGPVVLPLKKEGEFRFLMLSSYYKHKNFEIINGIISSFDSEARKNIKFVLTLPDDVYKQLISPENRDCVYNTGPVKPTDCPQLYRECDAIFLPTLLECFSATYAEAMKMQVPIVTTDLGFAHSVCGEAALYFKPLDVQDARDKIVALYKNSGLRQKLIEAGQTEKNKFNSSAERAVLFLKLARNLIKK